MSKAAPIAITALTLTPTGVTASNGEGLYTARISMELPASMTGTGSKMEANGTLGTTAGFLTPSQIAANVSRLMKTKGYVIDRNFKTTYEVPMMMSPGNQVVAMHVHKQQEKKKKELEEMACLAEKKEQIDLIVAARELHKKRPELLFDDEQTAKLSLGMVREMNEAPARGMRMGGPA